MAGLQLSTKKLSWVLKFEGDAIKAPEVKSTTDYKIKSVIEGIVEVPPLAACKEPKWVEIELDAVPEKHKIVALVLKIEGSVPDPKTSKPLKVYTDDPTKNKPLLLPDSNQSSAITFFKLLEGINGQVPQRDKKIYVTNENATLTKLSIQIAIMAE